MIEMLNLINPSKFVLIKYSSLPRLAYSSYSGVTANGHEAARAVGISNRALAYQRTSRQLNLQPLPTPTPWLKIPTRRRPVG